MDPEQMLRRLKDDDRWDGMDYIPQEEKTVLKRSPWRNALIPVAAALVLGLATATTVGLFGSQDSRPSNPAATQSPSPKMEDGAALDDEFIREAKRFPRPLPSGDEYPTPRFSDSTGSYPVGTGATMVASTWVCHWEQAYLSATDLGDEAAKKQAMDEIDAFATLPIVKSKIPEWATRYQTIVAPAKNGNTDQMRQSLNDGCPIMGT